MADRGFMEPYEGEYSELIAYPLGGLGAGMICVEGRGALSHVSVRHMPALNHSPVIFGAICIKGSDPVARVLEGPVPRWKIAGQRGHGFFGMSSTGLFGTTYGLPRFANARFSARFPFATIAMDDPALPVSCRLTAWSPFLPGNADDSGLPAAALEYTFRNDSEAEVEAVFSFHAMNFMKRRDDGHHVERTPHGFVLAQDGDADHPADEGVFAIEVDESAPAVDAAWFRGGWFDALTMLWKSIAHGDTCDVAPYDDSPKSPGGSLYVPLRIPPGGERTVRVRLSWFVPNGILRHGNRADGSTRETYRPWYAEHFRTADAVRAYWAKEYARLRQASARFSQCFHDSTLPEEVMEALDANLCILKSPTLLREADGRLWGYEGCNADEGCCHGTCTHVYNYVQALACLFPALERGLRETEFLDSQMDDGFQVFRSVLPHAPSRRDYFPAADGQLGGIIKAWRDWRISGDTQWLRTLWPRVRQSLNFCIDHFDPTHRGAVEEPHHVTYDIEFWGPNSFSGGFYATALAAACDMARALGEDPGQWPALLAKARNVLETELWNGEHFIQRIQWKNLRSPTPDVLNMNEEDPNRRVSAEAAALMHAEGPKYQYGNGVLSDGVLGFWIGEMNGLPPAASREKIRDHLRAVFRHNFRRDLSTHANPQRPGFACDSEAGLLLCSWPNGDQLSLPFVYSNEVWTGIEYEVASYLAHLGDIESAREIVRATRARYDGRTRNPFAEYECGYWYIRALASYSLLYAFTGARYDAIEKKLHINPPHREDFRAFLCWQGGYGTIGLKNGIPFIEVAEGEPIMPEGQ